MKKVLSILLCMSIFLMSLTACQAQPGSSEGSQQVSTSIADTDTEAENIEMRFCWWGAENRHNATIAALNLYHEKFSNITITGEYGEWTGYVDKLMTQLASGTAADIIQVDSKLYYDLTENKDLLVDMNTMGDIIDLSQYDPDFLKNYCSYNDMLVGVPTGMNAITLLFSEQFFDEHGVDKDTVWTWDNLLEIGERVHQDDPEAYLFFADPMNLQLLTRAHIKQQIGTQLINDDYTMNITQDVLTNTFSYVLEMLDRGVCQPFEETSLYTDVQETNPKWIAGELGMTVKHCSLINRFAQSGFDISTAIIPQMEDAKDTGILISVANLLSINKNSPYIDEAAEFINWFMTDKDAILTLGECRSTHSTQAGRTILDEAGVSDSVVSNAVNEALENASSFAENGISQNQELEAIMVDALENVGFRRMTPEDAASFVIDSYQNVLEGLKS